MSNGSLTMVLINVGCDPGDEGGIRGILLMPSQIPCLVHRAFVAGITLSSWVYRIPIELGNLFDYMVDGLRGIDDPVMSLCGRIHWSEIST